MTGTAPDDPSVVVAEFRQFVQFLQGLWAVLASVSVLFPLSNAVLDVIPLGQWTDGGFVYLSPVLVSAVATLACLFVVLWTFGQREEMRARRAWNALPRQAVRSFVLGGVSLMVYMAGHYAISHDFYFQTLGWESDDLRRIAGDLVLVLAYAGGFVLLTRAFLALGLREYLRGQVAG